MQREREIDRRRLEVADAGGDRRGQVREVGERDGRGAARDARRRTSVASASTHRVDDQLVLACVLLGAHEVVGAQPGAGHRAGGHASDPFAARAAPGSRRRTRCRRRRCNRAASRAGCSSDRRDVERLARVDHDLACEHDLLDGAGVDEREDGGDVRFPGVGAGDLRDRCSSPGVAAGGGHAATAAPRRARRSCATRGRRRRARRCARARSSGRRRRTAARRPPAVRSLARGRGRRRARGRSRAASRRRRAGVDDRGDARRSRTRAAPSSHARPVGAEVVEQTSRPSATSSVRATSARRVGSEAGVGAGHERVPVISWAAPAPSVRCATSIEAGRADHLQELGPRREVRGRARAGTRTRAGRRAGRRRTARRAGTTSRARARAGALVGSLTSTSAMRPRGRSTRAHSASTAREVDEVAEREPAREAVERHRRRTGGGPRRRARAARRVRAAASMPAEKSTPIGAVPVGGERAAQVAGAAREVEHARARDELERVHRGAAPARRPCRSVSMRLSRS